MIAYTRRHYNFQRDGRSNFAWLRRRHDSQASAATNHNHTLDTIKRDHIIHPERLLEAFCELRREGGSAPGIDRLTFSDYGRSEIAGVLRGVARSIREGTYQPSPSRRVSIPKANWGRRVLRIRTLVDRTVGKALARALTPLIDRLFSERSFGFRPGRSHLQMLAALEAWMMETDEWVLAVDDIRQAFDNVPIATAVSNYRMLIADSALINLIEVVLRGHEGAQRERGIDQGCPCSPLTLNVLLHEILDRPIQVARETPSLYRYADNLAFVSGEVPEGEHALQRVREVLKTHGFELKGQDGPPVDLRRNGSRTSLFNFLISKGDDRLRYELKDQAWQDLKDGLEESHLSERPGLTARNSTRGWIQGHAPAFATDVEAVILRRIRSNLRQTGLQYEVPVDALRESMGRARTHWEHLRSQARRLLLEQQLDLPQRSAPRAVHQPVASCTRDAAEADDSVLPPDAVDAELSARFER